MLTFREYLGVLDKCLLTTKAFAINGEELQIDKALDQAMQMIKRYREYGKIMLVGNGGSAAIAAHVQNDLVHTAGIRAMEFTAQPLLTALANDNGYQTAFPSLVGKWAEPGDLLIAISSSGRSQNIIESAQIALEKDAKVMTFTGFDAENPLQKAGGINFYVASHSYGIVESSHAVILHYLTDSVAGLEIKEQ